MELEYQPYEAFRKKQALKENVELGDSTHLSFKVRPVTGAGAEVVVC